MSIGRSAFEGCAGLTSIIIPTNVTSIDSLIFSDCTSLTNVEIPDGVTSIGYAAFQNCASLTNIRIPNCVTSIGDSAFYGCASVTNIEVPDQVAKIGNSAFSGCNSLKSITLPFVGDSPTATSHTFSYFFGKAGIPSSLKMVTITGGENIPNSAFYNCTSLTNISIPSTVTSIGSDAFRECTGLTNFVIPNGVTSIESSTFAGCTGLSSITIPNSVTSIWTCAFEGCVSLTNISIPSSVTSIWKEAFAGCTGLTSIEIPSSVTTIGDYAFYRIKNIVYDGVATGSPWGAVTVNGTFDGDLIFSDKEKRFLTAHIGSKTDVVIPASTQRIGEYAFDGEALTSITCLATIPPTCNGSWYSFGNTDQTTCSLYVTEESLTWYRLAGVWKDFYNVYTISAEGLTEVETLAEKPNYYNLQGQKVATPQRGDVIVRKGKKTLVK